MTDKRRVFIINSPVDCLSVNETIEVIEETINKKKRLQHVCVNAGNLVKMQKDEFLKKAVIESDIISADGQSVVWASKFLSTPLPERVNGTNLMEDLIAKSFEKGYKCFFFGAKEEIVKKVITHYSNKYSNKIIAGYRNGYYNMDDEKEIVDRHC